MKRIALTVATLLLVIGTANAQFKPEEASKYPNLTHPVVLAAPDLPDVAECRDVPQQLIHAIVDAAVEDPGDTFEKNRKAHPHMIMMPVPIECASKLWKVQRRGPSISNSVTVP